MKKQKWITRVLPIFLAAFLLFGIFPASAAQGKEILSEVAEITPVSRITGENIALRDENAKHFLHENGSITAVVYADPVHFKNEAGDWQEVDNTLSLDNSKRSVAGKATYTTAATGLDIAIPQEFSNGQKLTISKDGFTVGIGPKEQSVTKDIQQDDLVATKGVLVNNEKALLSAESSAEAKSTRQDIDLSVKANIINDYAEIFEAPQNEITKQTITEKIQADNAKIMEADNKPSAVVYRNIFLGSDLEYIVSSNKIKENIIVREPQQEYLYHFDVSLGGLIPVPQEDGSIFLLKDTQDSEPLFIIEAPYMYDAAGEASTDVKMHFAEDGTLVLEADPAWANAEERVYPVYIDPTFTHARETKATEMAYVSTAVKSANYSGQLTPEMYVGDALLGDRRTYMRITLPSIPKVSVINSATLKVNQTNIDYSPAGLYLQVYQVPANPTYGEWDVGDVNWNNQPMGTAWPLPSNRATLLDQKAIVNSNKATYSFNIKNAVVNWRDTGINSGLGFTTSNENTGGQIRIASDWILGSGPVLSLNYSFNTSLLDTALTQIAASTAGGSKALNYAIADAAIDLAGFDVYNKATIENFLLSGAEFTGFQAYDYGTNMLEDWLCHIAPHTIAHKVINTNVTVVVIAIMGTGTEHDKLGSLGKWASNLSSGFGNPNEHSGFNTAATKALSDLTSYLSARGLGAPSNTKLRFLITGHSRGASVGSMLSAKLNTTYKTNGIQDRLFCYSFAPAKQVKTITTPTDHANIFNILNTYDSLVEGIPLGSGWQRYGVYRWFDDPGPNATFGYHRAEVYRKNVIKHTLRTTK